MADDIKVTIPDIGGATDVDVIEIMIKVGDQIKANVPLIMLESDKASMEIPSPRAGKIKKIAVKVGDKVCEGDLILTLENTESAEEVTSSKIENNSRKEVAVESLLSKAAEQKSTSSQSSTQTMNVLVPDIGGATDVDVIEILVKNGEAIKKDQALITLEGDKATMDIPAPAEGKVKNIAVKIGDKVSQGALILVLETANEEPPPTTTTESEPSEPASPTITEQSISSESVEANKSAPSTSSNLVFAGPAVRRLAREFGVDLALVKGSGRKSRVTKEDVQAYVKTRLSEKNTGANAFALPQLPVIDFSKFGEVSIKPLNKIKRLTGVNVHRAWITIPHVTQFDEADITELEAFRKSESDTASQGGYKLTILAFVTKVVAKALVKFPQFNASLDASGENLIYKQYFNIGIAVETPNGLVVPVIKGVDKLSIGEIALEMARLSKQAREKGITPQDMSGGCFTISSLGGIGGTAFTPIVNSPEVAILGLSRSSIKPVYEQNEFKPRLMLPLSLSYDHRVIDGAEAARFTRYLADTLSDIRRVLL